MTTNVKTWSTADAEWDCIEIVRLVRDKDAPKPINYVAEYNEVRALRDSDVSDADFFTRYWN
jgi:hypothetical protein